MVPKTLGIADQYIIYIISFFPSLPLSDTRETAVVNAILTAGAARRIAEDCREENFFSCTCITDGRPVNVNGTLTLTDCNFDDEHAKNIMEEFLIENTTSLVDRHNFKLGLNVSISSFS